MATDERSARFPSSPARIRARRRPDFPLPIGGLYLGGAGCHGGPGITFTRGYNAAYGVLDGAS